jgi:NAD(P)-dependent dehydrogenase (short-subunit alcohol dehydrogenase family)
VVADRFDLTGRVAVVTGGSRGLGRAIALGLAEAGADVAIVSRNLESCEATAREVAERTGRQAWARACHVGRWDQLDGLVDDVYERFGQLDILVNNAGMSPQYDQVVDVTERLFDSVLNLNLKGPFRLSALVGTRMSGEGGGSIINISSIAAVRPYPRVIPYAASKAGLNAMTLALAHSFGSSVRVNCVLAGPFETDIAQAWSPEMRARRTSALAAGRIGQPEEIVGAVVYLASDASSFTTGALLTVDGGTPVP